MRYQYDILATEKIDEFFFDKKAADLVVQFFENYLVHIKGSQFANSSFILEKWQKEILRNLFGWKKKSDNTRRFRECYIEIPRKNGKSSLCAGIGLYLLFADKEQGAEVYSAAADRSQAAIVFDTAKEMIKRNETLLSKSESFKNSIIYPKFASSYKCLSADAFTKHGLNAHGIIFDELHAQPDRELYDVLLTSTGSRMQPLMVSITTAGYDKNSICYEKHEYARMISQGIIDDSTFYPVVFGCDPDDDWKSVHAWKKANPNFNVSISQEYFEKECQKAIDVPSYENTFKRLHLNMWTEQDVRWLPMDKYDNSIIPEFNIEDLYGKSCYVGMDLSTVADLTSIAAIFPCEKTQGYFILPKFFIPKENLYQKMREDKVPYDKWEQQGYLTSTDGNVVDYEFIQEYITNFLMKKFNVVEIGYDSWNATQFALQLQKKGVPMFEVRQGFKTMNEPSQNFLKLVLAGKIYHNKNPVLRWNASNCVISHDAQGNIKPSKAKSNARIDGIVATIMAMSRHIFKEEAVTSVYANRGLITL